MRPFRLTDINLMQLQIFIRAAEYANFAMAAEELHLTASMVSKRIASLEAETGLYLFIRDKNRVSLTPAGKELYEHWKNINTAITVSLEKAHHIQAAERNCIIFGLSASFDSNKFFTAMIEAYQNTNPQLQYKVGMRLDFDFIPGLISGDYDIAFVPLFVLNKVQLIDTLDFCTIGLSPLYAGMSTSHLLASKPFLNATDLKDVGFIISKPDGIAGYHDMIVSLCETHGFHPRIERYVDEGASAWMNLNDNNVFITDKYYHEIDNPSIIYREISDSESGLTIVWKKSCTPNVKRVIRFVRNYYLEHKV